MDILWKGIVGGLITALIAWLSKRGNVLPGILPLFPTFGLIAMYIVGARSGSHAVQATCLASLKTIPAYLVFLLVCFLASARVNFRAALVLGLAGWVVMAVLVFLIPQLK